MHHIIANVKLQLPSCKQATVYKHNQSYGLQTRFGTEEQPKFTISDTEVSVNKNMEEETCRLPQKGVHMSLQMLPNLCGIASVLSNLKHDFNAFKT